MIENDDIDRLKEIFITRKECDDRTDAIERKLAADAVELALIKQKLDQISWVSRTTLGTVIVALIGALLKLVLVG